MYADFKKPAAEVDGVELFHVLNEIKFALNNIDRWTAPIIVDAPITMLGTRSFIRHEPLGVCLIISPWNYPFSLCAGPLVSALAAGNNVLIKPSELTPNVSGLIKSMAADIFDDNVVTVIEGGADIAQYLISLPFDHIFFTGSPAVGKMIMKAAAENLSSVTLELGGKSPAIITSSANMKDAAERVAVAKFINNGQTCIAPDYILVDERVSTSFVQQLIVQTKNHFTENNENFDQSKHYARIVNEKHFNRLTELLLDALSSGARIAFEGPYDKASLFFHPTILTNVACHARLLEEEIFGPILPIITYKNIEEAIAIINSKPKALALYLFTTERKIQEKVLQETTSGAVCINDCAIHFLHHNLPFGGVNNSGIGKSHGYFGFLAFSNKKPVMKQRRGLTSVKAFYPPYTPFKQKLMDWFLKFF
jgi:aldehyde dehydrogenase (NAD+)